MFLLIFYSILAPIDNNRYAKLEFKAQFDATLHGFSGYFDSHLYRDVDLSKRLQISRFRALNKCLTNTR